MRRPLSILLCAPLFLGVVAAVHADPEKVIHQADTRSMSERFGGVPNYNLTYSDPSIKAYGETKAITGTKNNDVKSFNFLGAFRTKDYSTTPYNTGGYWAGNFKFKTTEANLDSHSPITSIIRLFKTKTAETKTDRAASDTFKTRPDLLTSEKGNAVFRGKIQGKLDKQGPTALQGEDPIRQGDMHVMSIDEVRDLLNKTK